MAVLAIRDLDDSVCDRLRVQAASKGRSMEAEARDILSRAVSPVGATVYDVLRAFRQESGGVGIDSYLPSRDGLDRPVPT